MRIRGATSTVVVGGARCLAATVLVAVVAAMSACGVGGGSSPGPSAGPSIGLSIAGSAAATATPRPTPRPTPTPTSTGATLTVGGVRLRIEAPSGATLTTAAAGRSARLVAQHLDGDPVRVTVDAPAGATFSVELDGSVAVEDRSGSTVAGLAAPRSGTSATSGPVARPTSTQSSTSPQSPDADASVLTIDPDGDALTLWFGDGTPRSAVWGVAEGGRSLAVDPSTWARSAGAAGGAATWTALVAERPDADSPGMHDQLTCHAIGAPDKATWNLEPWRPDVGLAATVVARCNPR